MIELYGTEVGSSSNVYKVLLLLEELGEPYRLNRVNLAQGEQFRPEFLEINPNNKVPAILDRAPADGGDPVRLFESGSILLYLADKAGRFVPPVSEPRARAEVINWLFWQVANLGPYVGQLFHFLVYAPKNLPYPIERYQREVSRTFGLIEKRLSQSPWMGGAEYSIADMAIYPLTDCWKDAPQAEELAKLSHVHEWRARIQERPAYARVYDLSRIPNEQMGADKFFEETTWKRLFSQDQDTAATYAAGLQQAG